ncbi:MAG: SDR family NAD(P)-dependent oxidoreductase [Solirubrobacterales bacterium]
MGSGLLKHKKILVTGASSGIGWALAKAYAARGATLVLLARRRERLQRLAEEIEADGGMPPSTVICDLSIKGEAKRAADEILADHGGLDVLLNNAGGAVGGSVWAVADGDEARSDFEVDLWSPLALIGAFVPEMRRRGSGTVINVTSLRQVFAWPSFGQNTAAQAALASITETLRLELEPFQVKVVEVIPGPIETAAQGPTKLIPGIIDAIHGRLGTATPEELAEMVVAATIDHRDRVFCPEESGRRMYENPVQARADIAADARRVQAELPANEMVDTLVIGADHPLMLTARQQWEDEQ